jgi:hypothetical protein
MNELQRLINKYPDKRWNWCLLSENPNITMSDVLRYPEMSWDWSWLSVNPNITMSDVLRYPDKPWDYDSIYVILILLWLM